MADTPRLDLPYLSASQAQKEIMHNVSLDRLDLLVQCVVLDRNLATPPASPTLGDAYIVGAAPTGVWVGHANDLALYINLQWQFIAPLPGFQCWVLDEAVQVGWSGSAWTITASGGAGATTLLGLTDTPDAYAGQAGKTLLVNPGETAMVFGTTAGSAPVDATYIVSSSNTTLTAERVVTDNGQITWDVSTAGQLKAGLVVHGVTLDKLPQQPEGTLLGRGGTLEVVDDVQVITVGAGLALTGTTLSATGGGAGSSDFLGLSDTPDSYSGQAGKMALVNTGETGLEFSPPVPGPAGPEGPAGPPGQSAGRIFYLVPSDASDIAGYKTLLESPSPGAEVTIPVSCTGTGDVAIGSFATEPGVPGDVPWPPGTVFRRIFASTSAGSARLHVEVYKRVAAGTETLVRSEFSPAFSNTTAVLQDWTVILPYPGVAMTATDRLVCKVYAQRVSGPGTITVTGYFEGTSGSHIQTTISAGAQGPVGPPGPAGASTFLALTDSPDSYAGQAGKGVTVNGAATGLEFTTAVTGSYDLGLTWAGTLPVSQVLLRYPFPRAVDFPAGLTGSRGVAATAATALTSLDLRKNGTSVGSVQYAAGATTATFAMASATSCAAGDVLTVHAPGTADATLADLGLSLAGTRAVAAGEMGATTFLGLTDTPDVYASNALKILRVNAGATATEFGPVLGSMAQQDASAVAITGGSATLADLDVDGLTLRVDQVNHRVGLGTATPSVLLDVAGQTRLSVPSAINAAPQSNISLRFHYQKSGMAAGMWCQPTENDAASTPALLFTNVAGTSVGSIVTSATTTAYNTTSDRRLKEAFAALTDGLATVRALRPWRFRWRATGELGTGFVAEEVQPLVPQAVTGIPGAVDAQGQVVPMGLDASKLLPHLVAAVQELAQQVQALTARLAALEGP